VTPELVSVITPVFGGTETLSECVKSVLQQSRVHWEMLIVADDGVDHASELDRQGIADERLRFLDTGEYRRGPNIARNVGLRLDRCAA